MINISDYSCIRTVRDSVRSILEEQAISPEDRKLLIGLAAVVAPIDIVSGEHQNLALTLEPQEEDSYVKHICRGIAGYFPSDKITEQYMEAMAAGIACKIDKQRVLGKDLDGDALIRFLLDEVNTHDENDHLNLMMKKHGHTDIYLKASKLARKRILPYNREPARELGALIEGRIEIFYRRRLHGIDDNERTARSTKHMLRKEYLFLANCFTMII